MIRRRQVLTACGATCLLIARSGIAQQAARKLYRVGYMSIRARINERDEAFRQGLRELGYIEGQNLVVEWRFTNARHDLLPSVAAELVRLKCDCIVTSGTTATRAAKQVTKTIPIVMANASDDPVKNGLVVSLNRPGGNVTGVVGFGVDLVAKRLEILKETIPNLSRIGILRDPASETATATVEIVKSAAPTLGLQALIVDVKHPDNLENAFSAAMKERLDAMMVSNGGWPPNHPARLAAVAARFRMPVMCAERDAVLQGGLMSYDASQTAQFRRVATYVDRIFKGAKPADLPIEQPSTFELFVNLRAARQIGLRIPESVLARADRVIE